MKTPILAGLLTIAAGISLLAQQAGAPPTPAPKSPEESKAITALFNAQGNPDATIAAAEDLLAKFKDTQFKEAALALEADAWRSKRDMEKAQVYGERVLAVNPYNLDANLMLSEIIVQTTPENALGKDEKLGNAEKYLKTAQQALSNMAKPEAMPENVWGEYKQFTTARIRNNYGMLAMSKKDYAKAIPEFQAAAEGDPQQQAYEARLAQALLMAGKPAEAIQLCDKLLAKPDLNPTIKSFVTGVKGNASRTTAKPGAAAPAPAAPAPAPAAPPAK
jgi:tetratricopeptide (TPR) repeat protein